MTTCGFCTVHTPSVVAYVCVFLCDLRQRQRYRGDKMCPSSLCNYLPIFSLSVAFIIPFRSHLGVGDCHSVAPPSLSACWMKCRSPPTDLCLPAPAPLSPYLFPRNRRHLEIRVIINPWSLQLFMQWKRGGSGLVFFDTVKMIHPLLFLPTSVQFS